MNDAPIKQLDATRTETQPTELSEPHFDEIAVLIAQPVEPIARRERDWLAWLEQPRSMVAILVVAVLLGTTALALTQRHLDSAATEIQVDESQPKPESPLRAISGQSKSTVPRTKNRKARAGDTSGATKPVARRVGVIVYRSSSDRP